MSLLLVGWARPLAAGPDFQAKTTTALDRALSPALESDLAFAARHLKSHVAYVRATLKKNPDQPLLPDASDGWAVVDENDGLLCQAFVVRGAEHIRVRGPRGEANARVTSLDLERRIARLRTDRKLKALGLVRAPRSPPSERSLDMDLFALVSTRPGAGVVVGSLTGLGEEPGLEGHLRSDLRLRGGMPVFDGWLRWVGLARAVAWDWDQRLLIPPEFVEALSRTPTRSAPPPVEKPERPWWAR